MKKTIFSFYLIWEAGNKILNILEHLVNLQVV